jgi:hypothetical protein
MLESLNLGNVTVSKSHFSQRPVNRSDPGVLHFGDGRRRRSGQLLSEGRDVTVGAASSAAAAGAGNGSPRGRGRSGQAGVNVIQLFFCR